MASSKPLVLVTALSGYIGSACGLAFLRAGFRVRGTLRRQAQADAWIGKYPEWREDVEFAIVEDMGRQGSYEEACRGVWGVCHVASPFCFGYTDNERDMLLPAIRGTTEILQAAHRAGTVRKVVITSSFAALQDYHAGAHAGHVYTEEDWCPLTWDEAKQTSDQLLVYVASKKYAEAAAWRFVDEKQPQFTVTTILPVYVLGASPQPLESLDDLSVSASWIRAFFDAPKVPQAPLHAMVDIADVAAAHVAALERPAAAGNRYLVAAPGDVTGASVARLLRELFPDQAGRFPDPEGVAAGEEEEEVEHWRWDTARAERDLGMRWKSLKETVREAAEQVLELERKRTP
ncbi:hypothetical protein JCM1841_004688 [Sporobolomyces salmonicolor]